MKYKYLYKTSEGVKQEGTIEAPSRDDAFAALRQQGIRPIKLLAADGSKDNGAVNGVRKRIVAASVLIAIALTSGLLIWLGRDDARDANLAEDTFDNPTRRQIIGDSAIIEDAIRTRWASVFSDEGERYLAAFAIPGNAVANSKVNSALLGAALKRAKPTVGNDSIEARQIIAIVEGMKAEMRRFLSAGGSVDEYAARLMQRQRQELEYFLRAKNEIDSALSSGLPTAELHDLWLKRNSQLRAMGIKLVPWPE